MTSIIETYRIEQVLDVPITPAWGLLRDYDGWIKWWPIFESMAIIGDGKDVIGAVRKFKTISGTTYEEKLATRDESATSISFDIISMTPAIPFAPLITTHIKLQAVNASQTKITWYADTTVVNGTDPELVAKLGAAQKESELGGIKSLVQYLTLAGVWQEGLAFLNEKIMSLTKALLIANRIPPTTVGYKYDDYPVDMGPLPKMVRGLPVKEALSPHKIGQMLARLLEVVYLQANTTILGDGIEVNYKQATDSLANVYGNDSTAELTKHLTNNWDNDYEFTSQLLQGVNPLHIKLITCVSEVPASMKGETSTDGKNIEQLVKDKRLFILDYKDLIGLKQVDPHMYFHPAIMVVCKDVSGPHSGQLSILAIQLQREGVDGKLPPIFTPKDGHPLRFKLAKMFVGCADNQVHEFRYHLGISHLAMEPIVIACVNSFPEGHALRTFLQPHLDETIGINFLARQTLIAKNSGPVGPDQDPYAGAFTNKTFAVGTGGGVKIASTAWGDYHFENFSFPKQLEARGFDEKKSDGLNNYYFRDDGFLLWHAIGKYCRDVVNAQYPHGDSDVKKDTAVQNWVAEMSDPARANVKGFPKEITTTSKLIEALQIVIWSGSALHSFLNYPQWPYLGFIPNRPNALYQDMPPVDGKDIAPQYIQGALLPPFATLFQITFSWLLSLPSDTNLLSLEKIKGINSEAARKFHKRLLKITDKINERNFKLSNAGKAPYVFLLPENVAASVNI